MLAVLRGTAVQDPVGGLWRLGHRGNELPLSSCRCAMLSERDGWEADCCVVFLCLKKLFGLGTRIDDRIKSNGHELPGIL